MAGPLLRHTRMAGEAACPTRSLVTPVPSRGRRVGGVPAVGPRAFQGLVVRRGEHAALVAGLPADDLARLAALLAPLLQLGRPRAVGLDRLVLLLVPEQHL